MLKTDRFGVENRPSWRGFDAEIDTFGAGFGVENTAVRCGKAAGLMWKTGRFSVEKPSCQGGKSTAAEHGDPPELAPNEEFRKPVPRVAQP